jgi:hypothetical protein
VIAGQTGMAGSVVLEDGVVLAGQVAGRPYARGRARAWARLGTSSSIFLKAGRIMAVLPPNL